MNDQIYPSSSKRLSQPTACPPHPRVEGEVKAGRQEGGVSQPRRVGVTLGNICVGCHCSPSSCVLLPHA